MLNITQKELTTDALNDGSVSVEALSPGKAMQKLVLNSIQAIQRAAKLVAQLKPEQLMQIEITGMETAAHAISKRGLYWVWMQHLGKHLSTQQKTYCKDAMHDICRHKFLGLQVERQAFYRRYENAAAA